LLPLPEIEPRLSGCPSRILVTTVAQLSRIKYWTNLAKSYMTPTRPVFRFCVTTASRDMSFCLTSCTFNKLREQNLLPVRINTCHYTSCARRGSTLIMLYLQTSHRPLSTPSSSAARGNPSAAICGVRPQLNYYLSSTGACHAKDVGK